MIHVKAVVYIYNIFFIFTGFDGMLWFLPEALKNSAAIPPASSEDTCLG